MVAIPQWLKTTSDADQHKFRGHREPLTTEGAREQLAETTGDSDAHSSDVPIFCAGGCGEVVGYLPKGHKVLTYKGRGYEHWCPKCEAAEISKKRLTVAKTPFTSTDELAGLFKPPRDLRRLRLTQAAAVSVIIAGSVCIAMGRVVGIYLAALGTLAWFATYLVLWKMRD
jgi:hypothetical protein